jgi:ribulose-5-phosphate 4-epimerase/fuculose-1-phosphate aldolase
MINTDIKLLQLISEPFSHTGEHVQGPGGNTSVKFDSTILIKASGFTFKDVANGSGVVSLNNTAIISNLTSKINSGDKIYENEAPQILGSIPDGLKPSMEFEFHALLDMFVLHTHSVYVNVIACADNCDELLKQIFNDDEYLLVPYVTPGFPIAEYLLKNKTGLAYPPVIVLKNHGVIVHGSSAEAVVEKYKYTIDKIMAHCGLQPMPDMVLQKIGNDNYLVDKANVVSNNIDVATLVETLNQKVLIPDQSIFFKGKVSSSTQISPGIFANIGSNEITLQGNDKFILACKTMIQAVYYISNNIKKLGLQPDYIPAELISIMHNLSTEKYRSSILEK